MPENEHVEIKILVDGRELPEYPDPEGPPDADRNLTRYVEAKAGQTFSSKMAFLPGFDFGEFAWTSQVFFDNHPPWVDTIPIDSFISQGKVRDNVVVSSVELEMSKVVFRDETTGRFHEHRLVFGVFGPSEDTAAPVDMSSDELDALGSITVLLYRSTFIPCSPSPLVDAPEVIDQLPEGLVQDKMLKNTINFEQGDECQPVPVPDGEWMPIFGPHAKFYTFVFKYRTKKILQSIGCIPRTPSPPADAAFTTTQTSTVPRMSRKEAREQTLRKIKQESDDKVSLKREREGDEDEDETEELPARKRLDIIKIEDE